MYVSGAWNLVYAIDAATLDGRLLALDAASGALLWATLTIDQA